MQAKAIYLVFWIMDYTRQKKKKLLASEILTTISIDDVVKTVSTKCVSSKCAEEQEQEREPVRNLKRPLLRGGA